MKKLITLLLALIMIVGILASCGGTKPAETTKTPSESGNKPQESGNATGGNETTGTTEPTLPPEKTLNIDLETLDYGNRESSTFTTGQQVTPSLQ